MPKEKKSVSDGREVAEPSHGPFEIEATWAPKDPRDKLYDEGATKKERAESMVRIFAAFHPVMNGPLLLFDLFKRIGFKWSLVVFVLLAAGIFFLIFG